MNGKAAVCLTRRWYEVFFKDSYGYAKLVSIFSKSADRAGGRAAASWVTDLIESLLAKSKKSPKMVSEVPPMHGSRNTRQGMSMMRQNRGHPYRPWQLKHYRLINGFRHAVRA